jgi:hypothetical protein
MAHRIAHVSVLQAAKMFAVLYAIMGLLFLPFFFMASRLSPSDSPFPFGGVFFLLLPLIYGCIGFVFTAIGAAFYNLVAGWIGGIEVDLADAGPAS